MFSNPVTRSHHSYNTLSITAELTQEILLLPHNVHERWGCCNVHGRWVRSILMGWYDLSLVF